jgi:hypothetical protein
MASAEKDQKRYKHSPDTAWRRVEGEAVILDLKSSRYYSLNDSAAFIWERLDSGATVSEIAPILSAEYDVSTAAAARDAAALVRDLQKEKLLVPAARKKN